jgi:hypothetical protein
MPANGNIAGMARSYMNQHCVLNLYNEAGIARPTVNPSIVMNYVKLNREESVWRIGSGKKF